MGYAAAVFAALMYTIAEIAKSIPAIKKMLFLFVENIRVFPQIPLGM